MRRSTRPHLDEHAFNPLLEGSGWLGTIAIIVGYFLITLTAFSPHSWVYIVLNIFGSIAIAVEAAYKKDYQPVLLNIVWLVIALVSLLQILK